MHPDFWHAVAGVSAFVGFFIMLMHIGNLRTSIRKLNEQARQMRIEIQVSETVCSSYARQLSQQQAFIEKLKGELAPYRRGRPRGAKVAKVYEKIAA